MIPIDSPPPDQYINKGKKKFSYESYYLEKTLLIPTISDKLKIIKINKNFENNYRNNLLECIDILYGLEPDKLDCIDNLNNHHEKFIKCLLTKLSEKYKKEIVDMSINFPKEGEEDEANDTGPKQTNEEN